MLAMAQIEQCLRRALPNAKGHQVSVEAVLQGAINDIYKLQVGGQLYALRVRVREASFAYERDILKELIIANFFAVRSGTEDPLENRVLLQNLVDNGVDSAVTPSKQMDFTPAVLFGDLSRETIVHPWVLQQWFDSDHEFGEAVSDYARLGGLVSVLHRVRFDHFVPRLDQTWQKPEAWIDTMTDEVRSRSIELNLNPNAFLDRVKISGDRLRFTLTHNDFHPLNILCNAQDMKVIDWDNLQVAPIEFDFVKLKYWTAIDSSGQFFAQHDRFCDIVTAYEKASGLRLEPQITELCEVVWLLRVAQFETMREANGEVPKPFLPSSYYIQQLRSFEVI